MALSQKLRQKINAAIIAGIQRNGERIFHLSQQTERCFVPVQTGFLKRSGFVKAISNGVEIGYRSPYAHDVEFGIDAPIPITGTQIVHIRAYTRKDGTKVAAHDVEYKNKRLIGFRPKYSKFERGPKIFRVIKEIKPRPGQFFLTRALKEEIKHLPTDIAFALRRVGKVEEK